MQGLQYVALSKSRKNHCFELMKKGNPLIAIHSNRIFGKRKRRHFRKELFNGNINIEENCIPQKDYDAIMAVRKIEWEIIQCYVPLMQRYANNWFAFTKFITGGSRDDYKGEAVLSLIDSIYGFVGYAKDKKSGKKKPVQFLTYVCNAIKNGMIQYVSRSSSFGGLSNDSFLKAVKFENTILRCPNNTYDELVEIEGLSPEELLAIQSCLKLFINESQMLTCEKEKASLSDYTSFRDVKKDNAKEEQFDVQEILGKINMSDLEKDMLPHLLNPGWGWKSQLAEKHGCTRQNVCQTASRLKVKLESAYGSREKNE